MEEEEGKEQGVKTTTTTPSPLFPERKRRTFFSHCTKTSDNSFLSSSSGMEEGGGNNSRKRNGFPKNQGRFSAIAAVYALLPFPTKSFYLPSTCCCCDNLRCTVVVHQPLPPLSLAEVCKKDGLVGKEGRRLRERAGSETITTFPVGKGQRDSPPPSPPSLLPTKK